MENEEMLNYLNNFGKKQSLENFSNKVIVQSYIEKCKFVKSFLPKKSKILDWGGGAGHNSFILHNLGLDVSHYEINNTCQKFLLKQAGITSSIGLDSLLIPFQDNTFDAIVSFGVLEHVENENKSLAEIKRILKPNGLLFIFNLPYKYSPSEFLATHIFKQFYHHPRKYTFKSLKKILKQSRFKVLKIKFDNGVPKNLIPIKSFRSLYDRYYKLILKVDAFLTRTFCLRNIFSNSITCIAKNEDTSNK